MDFPWGRAKTAYDLHVFSEVWRLSLLWGEVGSIDQAVTLLAVRSGHVPLISHQASQVCIPDEVGPVQLRSEGSKHRPSAELVRCPG